MFTRGTKRVACAVMLALMGVMVFALAAVSGKEGSAEERVAILEATSYWRCHMTWKTAVARTEKGLEEFGQSYDTPLPPAGWQQPDFDDSSWCRTPGPFFSPSASGGFMSRAGSSPALGLLCLRGKFTVNDPKKVQALTLLTEYRGGLVVYVNGKELTHSHLPKGKIELATPADDYPPAAYVTPEGKGIRSGWGDPEAYKDRIALRTRALTDVTIPSSMLKKGVNVLALEVHRAPYAESGLVRDGRGNLRFQHGTAWTTIGVGRLLLQAAGDSGVVPNVERPKGFQLWNSGSLTAIFDMDYGDPNEPVRPIKLVGTQNGALSGQVVVSSEQPIKGLGARMSDLKLVGGNYEIPTSAVQVRYAQPGGQEGLSQNRYGGVRNVSRFDGLAETPPAEVPVRTKQLPRGSTYEPIFGAVQPIWVTVNVPGDARAGNYEGELTIVAEEMKPMMVPVHLQVCGWKVPDPKAFETFTDFVQSPQSVALQYNVPLWSDEHFELMAKSFKLIGQMGSKVVYIPLLCQTNFGNDQTMVRWIKGPDGTYTHDFSIMDRYLDLATKHMGKPAIVCLYVWDIFTDGVPPERQVGYARPSVSKRDLPHWGTALVSRLDPGTGKVEFLEGPSYYQQAEAEAFWRPVLAQIRDRLEKCGLGDAIMFGIVSDCSPVAETVALLDRILPGTKWVVQQHGSTRTLHGKPVGYLASIWRLPGPADPAVKRAYGWQCPYFRTFYARRIWFSKPLSGNRLVAEANLVAGQRGYGRVGADFWPVLEDERGRRRRITGRYRISVVSRVNILTSWLAPGPEGAISTVRFEMARENLQECEARIFIERALTDEAQRAKLGQGLAERCQNILDERVRAMLVCWSSEAAPSVAANLWYPASGWQERSAKLYRAAAEAQAALSRR